MLSNYIQLDFKGLLILLSSLLLLFIFIDKTREIKQVFGLQLSSKNIAIFSLLLVLLLSHFSAIQSNHVVLAIPNVPTNNNTLTPSPMINHPPVANAGVNQTVNENTTVLLYGIASDPDDGDSSKLTYLWKQIAGPAVKLDNDTGTNPSFIAPMVPVDRDLRFSLTARDDKGVCK